MVAVLLHRLSGRVYTPCYPSLRRFFSLCLIVLLLPHSSLSRRPKSLPNPLPIGGCRPSGAVVRAVSHSLTAVLLHRLSGRALPPQLHALTYAQQSGHTS